MVQIFKCTMLCFPGTDEWQWQWRGFQAQTKRSFLQFREWDWRQRRWQKTQTKRPTTCAQKQRGGLYWCWDPQVELSTFTLTGELERNCSTDESCCFNRFIKAYKKFGAPLERYGFSKLHWAFLLVSAIPLIVYGHWAPSIKTIQFWHIFTVYSHLV